MGNIVEQKVIAMPVGDVIRELRKEGWEVVKIDTDGATFKLSKDVLARVLRSRDN
ncbi:MAG: hypothetical protein WC231_01030 [Dehalococcoidales bacterium]